MKSSFDPAYIAERIAASRGPAVPTSDNAPPIRNESRPSHNEVTSNGTNAVIPATSQLGPSPHLAHVTQQSLKALSTAPQSATVSGSGQQYISSHSNGSPQAPIADNAEILGPPFVGNHQIRSGDAHSHISPNVGGAQLVPGVAQRNAVPPVYQQQHLPQYSGIPEEQINAAQMQHAPSPQQGFHQQEALQSSQDPRGAEMPQGLVRATHHDSTHRVDEQEQQDVAPPNLNETVDDIGNDPLLEMQKDLATFEDSVRSFVGAGSEKALFAKYQEDPTPRARPIVRRGPRKPAEPTGDVKLRLASASNAFMGGRLDEALDYVNDAIRINGEIHRAWSLLAEILRERKEYKQSLLALVCAAHLQPKIFDSWMQCAMFALQLLEEYPEDADDTSKIAIMVLSQAIMLEPNNLGVRQTRAALYFARESFKLSIKDYTFILEQTPYDVAALQGLVDASVQFSDSSRRASEGQREAARDAYSRCIVHFQAVYPNGASNPGLPFTWEDAFTYVTLLNHLGQYKDALRETRALSRWLLGRHDESFWDELEDDREWDKGDERRQDVQGFVSGKYPASSYGSSLPIRLRTSLAICRLRLDQDNDEEAMRHLEWLDTMDSAMSGEESQLSDLFLGVATALYETQRTVKALRFFEPLRDIPDCLDATALYHAGKCYLETGDRRQAEQCFTAVLDFEEQSMDTRINARYELAKMYEAARQNAEAYILVNEALNLEKDREGSSAESSGGPETADGMRKKSQTKRKATQKEAKHAVRKAKEKKADAITRKPREPGVSRRMRPLVFALDEDRRLEEERRSKEMAEKWRIVREERDNSNLGPGDTWMSAAKELVDDFRSFKAFYPWDRYLTHLGLMEDEAGPSSMNPLLLKMAQRLRDEADAQQASSTRRVHETTVSYRDVPFEEWLNLFLELALGLAHSGKIEESYSVCESAMGANVFFENPEDKFLINITMGACALRGRDEKRCVEVARSFLSNYQFASDGFRLYAALSRLCHSTATWYADSRVQKFTLRQIKLMDAALLPAEQKTKALDASDPAVYPDKELDVTMLMLYGHILFVSNSFTIALNYFVRAYALDPNNLMINISIGQAYLHYALKRQAENRQHLIAQGFAFIHKYYDMKVAAAVTSGERQEAHYNMARSYHVVGLTHLAAEYYRRVFREMEYDQPGDEDLAREAAFNLQMCCLVGGDIESMRGIAERWLVL